jgi:hypothetical protein
LYRRQAKLVSEAAYYFTNLVSAKTFVVDLSAKSLSMDEMKFEESMEAARVTNKATQIEASPTLQGQTNPIPSTAMHDKNKDVSGKPKTAKMFFLHCHLPAAVATYCPTLSYSSILRNIIMSLFPTRNEKKIK